MSLSPSRKGTVPFGPYRTWYRVTGNLDAPTPALVVVHGGPGSTHDYLLGLAGFAERGRPVVHYDQLGNGGSTHLPHADADFWTVRLFLDELANLLTALEIREYVLLGQSWGGLLAAEHAARRPSGLRGLIVANAPASYPLWLRELAVLRGRLPDGVDETLVRHEDAGTTDSAEYLAAMRVFYDRHVCRLRPWPQNLTASFMEIHNDPTVYRTMNGPSEFHVIGSLRDWSVVDRLPSIVVPTLLITGRHDEVTPASAQPYQDLVPDVRWEVFEESSHMPHLEEPQRFTDVVAAFLTGLPPRSTAPRPATVEHTR
ncbi:proline iminopeptidase-family hydrolase [Streptomyces sp. NPDC051987]|uniref:proline iminopeptidase-family hydrolase n=1 Tax=Streptomyces sp. NPDC051987 TaxID=3155808 RepID=UPI00343C8FD6